MRQDTRTMWQKVYDGAVLKIFPPWNTHMYIVYLSALIVFGTMMIILPIVMMLLVNGQYIETENFVAHQTTNFQYMNEYTGMWNMINVYLNLAGYVWLLLAIHTAISAVFDLLHCIWFAWREIESWWTGCPIKERDDL